MAQKTNPCAKGLTKECFKAYGTWAKKALAYRMTLLMLPKELTRLLPRDLRSALIGPGTTVPQGVVLPSGTTVHPDFSFPAGWSPGDPLPPGVIPPPDEIVPQSPEGPIPPIYVNPWEPGPITTQTLSSAPAFDIGSLIVTQGETQTSANLGDVDYWSDLAMPINYWLSAIIRAVDIKIGKNNTPTDKVHLEIWRCVSEWKPFIDIPGGISTTINASSLPAFSLDQDYIRFFFPQNPLLLSNVEYDIIVARSGTYDPIKYYKIGQNIYPNKNYYYKLPNLTWYTRSGGIFNFKIWGYLV